MGLAGRLLWFIIMGGLFSGILFGYFGLQTTLFPIEFYIGVGFLISAFVSIGAATDDMIYWIEEKLGIGGD